MICIPVSCLRGAINVVCQNTLSFHQDCEGAASGANHRGMRAGGYYEEA